MPSTRLLDEMIGIHTRAAPRRGFAAPGGSSTARGLWDRGVRLHAMSEIEQILWQYRADGTRHRGDMLRTLTRNPAPSQPARLDRALEVGVMPITANPIHSGHILIGRMCAKLLELDTVVYIIHGEITHKWVEPSARIDTELRHEMAKAALAEFQPQLQYSDVARFNDRIGESTVHDLRELNTGIGARFYYICGFETPAKLEFMAEYLLRFAAERGLWDDVEHTLTWCLVQRNQADVDLTSRIPNKLGSGHTTIPIRVVNNPHAEFCERFSSSDYRKTRAPELVPRAVHELVIKHRLYQPLPCADSSPGTRSSGEDYVTSAQLVRGARA